MEKACARAARDFAGAAAGLQRFLRDLPDDQLEAALDRHLLANLHSEDAVACTTYLLADARSVETALKYAQAAAVRGCSGDTFLVAFAGILGRSGDKTGSAALLVRHANVSSSTGLLTAAADRLRDIGRAAQAEYLLSRMIAAGRGDMRVRLAELFVEFRLWPYARAILKDVTGEPRRAYSVYLLGRAAAGLLLEDEVLDAIHALRRMPHPGRRFAAALSALWSWRIDADKPRRPTAGGTLPLPHLVARDLCGMQEERRHPISTRALPSRLTILPAWRGRITALAIGPQRTASTWLWTQFFGRSDVYALTEKEAVGFFDSHDGEKVQRRVADPAESAYWHGPTRSIHEYLALFDRAQPVRIDFSPVYAELPDATVALVRDILGRDTRIILGVRDPVERAWSHLKFDLKLTRQALADFSWEDRVAHYNSAASKRRGDIAAAYATWNKYFDRIALVHYEDVVARPDSVVAELERFLELAPRPARDATHRANQSTPEDMPAEDRAYLFSLYQSAYDAAAPTFGRRVFHWKQRHEALISQRKNSAPAA